METRIRRPEGENLASSGFWTIDLTTERVYGDANIGVLLGRTATEMEDGIHIRDSVARIRSSDRDRVRRALLRTITTGAGFREEYRIDTKARGWRRILAAGRRYSDTDGIPSLVSGWFADITEGVPSAVAMRIAAYHAHQASDAAHAAGDDLVAYLLDNVIEEIGDRLKNLPRD